MADSAFVAAATDAGLNTFLDVAEVEMDYILQLVDEGKIELDAPFGTYFRDAPRKDKATVRQLLSHTSGIYNFWANPRYGEITKAWWQNPGAGGQRSRSKEWTYEEMMGLVQSGYFKPGKGYHYSNTNYLLAAMITQPMSNAAAMVLIVPIAVDTATGLGANHLTFTMAVVIGAVTSFLTPIGHKNNTLIMGPGGYRFVDYLKVGVPLTIVIFIAVMILLPVFWPLTPLTP